MSAPSVAPRRSIATRDAAWARGLVHRLAVRGVRPNTVSLLGMGVAFLAGGAFAIAAAVPGTGRAAALGMAAAAIQLRLLCNLVDGMLAVEEGLKAKTGEIFNELPDRVADVAILVGAGYTAGAAGAGPALGWAAAVLAIFTAYVRVLAGSLGLTQHFSGPMAKPHRMAALTAAALVGALEALAGLPQRAIPAGLGLVIVGSGVTAARRIRSLLDEARAR